MGTVSLWRQGDGKELCLISEESPKRKSAEKDREPSPWWLPFLFRSLAATMAILASIGLSLIQLALLGRVEGVEASDAFLDDPGSKLCGYIPPGPLERTNPICQVNASHRKDFGLLPEDWAPWTHQPFCANSSYCVFTNSLFQRDHGISIITTPTNVAQTLHLLESSFTRRYLRPKFGKKEKPYVIKDIPGRGKGVVAIRKMRRGEKFMIDYASIIADVAFPAQVMQIEGQRLLERAVDDLPRREEVIKLARSRKGDERVVEDLLRTNSFGLKLNEMPVMALFPEISRINHDCAPNAFIRFSEQTLAMSAVALRDIEEGEEITISYSEFGLTSEQRKDAMLTRWGFLCTCALCRASPSETKKSDERRELINDLRDAALDHVVNRRFRQAIFKQTEMIEVMAEEKLLAPMGEYYQIQARLYNAIGDSENTKKYARMALEDLEVYGGDDYEADVADLRNLLGKDEE